MCSRARPSRRAAPAPPSTETSAKASSLRITPPCWRSSANGSLASERGAALLQERGQAFVLVRSLEALDERLALDLVAVAERVVEALADHTLGSAQREWRLAGQELRGLL